MRRLVQNPRVTFFLGLWIGMLAMGLFLSPPSTDRCCFDSSKPVIPHVIATSVDGLVWDTTWTYCAPWKQD